MWHRNVRFHNRSCDAGSNIDAFYSFLTSFSLAFAQAINISNSFAAEKSVSATAGSLKFLLPQQETGFITEYC